MKWLKYRVTWSHGKDHWEYEPIYGNPDWLNNKENLKEMLIEPIADKWNWSEHFRGVEYEILEPSQISYDVWDSWVIATRSNLLSVQECLDQLTLNEPPT